MHLKCGNFVMIFMVFTCLNAFASYLELTSGQNTYRFDYEYLSDTFHLSRISTSGDIVYQAVLNSQSKAPIWKLTVMKRQLGWPFNVDNKVNTLFRDTKLVFQKTHSFLNF
jgi:hypothetical protein